MENISFRIHLCIKSLFQSQLGHISKMPKRYEEFIQHYVFKRRFYSLVPDDIVKDHEIGDYTLGYSYFHFPMFDEAIRKLLRMYEMVLKTEI